MQPQAVAPQAAAVKAGAQQAADNCEAQQAGGAPPPLPQQQQQQQGFAEMLRGKLSPEAERREDLKVWCLRYA